MLSAILMTDTIPGILTPENNYALMAKTNSLKRKHI